MKIRASLVACVMVSVATLGAIILIPEKAVAALPNDSTDPVASSGPGFVKTLEGAKWNASWQATFRRWDGTWKPSVEMSRATGDWPYQTTDTADTLTVRTLEGSFTQAKVPGARYEFPPTGVKEVIELATPPAPIDGSGRFGLLVPLATDLVASVEGTSVVLRTAAGTDVWRTAPFLAWDSSVSRRTWDRPVTSVSYAGGVLDLTLDPTMIDQATYPLYVDPSWTLSNIVGWGASTFQHAVVDAGDQTVVIGWLADSFDDNTNDIWTVESGSATFAGGVMQLQTGTLVRAGPSTSDHWVAFMVRFTSSGTAQAYFRYQDASNHYVLDISEPANSLTLKKKVAGSVSTIATVTGLTINVNTNYWGRIRANGNAFEIWWPEAVLRWSGNDGSPPPSPLSGPIKFGTDASAAAYVDEVRVWNKPSGMMTTPVRDAAPNVPLETKVGVADVTSFSQVHVRIRSSADNVVWGPWTNLKADLTNQVFHKVPDQNRLRYYQLRVVLTSGTDHTTALWQVSTNEGTAPAVTPAANTGAEPWYSYVGGLANAVNGNLFYSTGDLSIRGRGFPLAMVRSYNSLRGTESGPLGNGWTHAYSERLVVNGDTTVTWNDGDGSQHTFTPKGTWGWYGSPRGITSRLVKNTGDGTFALWHLDGTRHSFSSAGVLTTLTDRDGNKLTFTYDGNGRLTTIADDSGKSLTLGYDASNRITTLTDPQLNRQIVYGYTGSELTSVRDTHSHYENYTYAAGKMSAIIDPIGKRTAFMYDESSRVTEIWLGLYQGGGVVWQFKEYSIAYTTTTARTITNARGFSTTLTLNSLGNPIQTAGPSIGSACCDHGGNSSAYVWDGEMNKIKTTDGRGFSTVVDHDHRGRLQSTTDPGGNVSSATYSESNTATQYFSLVNNQTNFRGFTTTYGYDGNGHLVRITDAKADFAENGYDSLGFLNSSTDFRGAKTWYEYNSARYLTKMTNPLNHVTLYGYDAVGRGTTVTSPEGHVTATVYDSEDRVTRVTDPLGNFSSFGYNARGDRTRTTDPNGWSTVYSINVTNHRVRIVTDPLGNQTTLSYDLRGNLLSVTDANNHETSYEYDAFDRRTKVTPPLGYATSSRFDASGNRIGRTDANGAATTFSYDKSNRLTQTRYPGGSTTTLAYDKNSNPTSEAGLGYTKTSGYDELDRITSVTMNYGSFSKTTTYTYDANGNRLTALDPESGMTSYAYDAVNRQWKVTDPETRATAYLYDRDSRVTSVTYANGVVTTNTWNATSRLTKVETRKSDSTLIERFEYGYDKTGNRLSVKLANASITWYEYDKLDRLTKMTEPGSVVTTYEYDAVGNLVEEKKASTTKTYAYDADDRLWDITVGTAGMRYGYDNNGNRIWAYDKATGVNTSFSYDYENRMTARGTCTYTYAPNGERMSSACSAPTYYRYEGPSGGGLSNVAAEYDSTGVRQARYTHGPGVDEPVEQLRAGSYYTYQKDGLGSVSKITDTGQNTVNAYTYGPWGDTSSSGSLANPFEFAGREADSGSSLYHYRARVYDPEARRFVQKDPAGMCDGTNLYAYVANNPVTRIDPSGEQFRNCGWWDVGCHFANFVCAVCIYLASGLISILIRVGFPTFVKLCLAFTFGVCSPLAPSGGVGYGLCLWMAMIACITIIGMWVYIVAVRVCQIMRLCV